MRASRAQQWIESYLYAAREHRALAESVFAEGERHGFSERKLRRAAQELGIHTSDDCWQLPERHAAALHARPLRELGREGDVVSRRSAPEMALVGGRPHMRVRRVA